MVWVVVNKAKSGQILRRRVINQREECSTQSLSFEKPLPTCLGQRCSVNWRDNMPGSSFTSPPLVLLLVMDGVIFDHHSLFDVSSHVHGLVKSTCVLTEKRMLLCVVSKMSTTNVQGSLNPLSFHLSFLSQNPFHRMNINCFQRQNRFFCPFRCASDLTRDFFCFYRNIFAMTEANGKESGH